MTCVLLLEGKAGFWAEGGADAIVDSESKKSAYKVVLIARLERRWVEIAEA
mgnify:CR=1 FL=1